jgi:hypothetical protein
MYITIEKKRYAIDIRFVKGIRVVDRSRFQESVFSCVLHGFRGTKSELRKHLKLQHPEIFTEEMRS